MMVAYNVQKEIQKKFFFKSLDLTSTGNSSNVSQSNENTPTARFKNSTYKKKLSKRGNLLSNECSGRKVFSNGHLFRSAINRRLLLKSAKESCVNDGGHSRRSSLRSSKSPFSRLSTFCDKDCESNEDWALVGWNTNRVTFTVLSEDDSSSDDDSEKVVCGLKQAIPRIEKRKRLLPFKKKLVNIPLSSPLGQRTLPKITKEVHATDETAGVSMHNHDSEFCETNSVCDDALNTLLGNSTRFYPVVYRSRNSASYCHRYCFSPSQGREDYLRRETGLGRKSRELLQTMKKCRVRLERLADEPKSLHLCNRHLVELIPLSAYADIFGLTPPASLRTSSKDIANSKSDNENVTVNSSLNVDMRNISSCVPEKVGYCDSIVVESKQRYLADSLMLHNERLNSIQLEQSQIVRIESQKEMALRSSEISRSPLHRSSSGAKRKHVVENLFPEDPIVQSPNQKRRLLTSIDENRESTFSSNLLHNPLQSESKLPSSASTHCTDEPSITICSAPMVDCATSVKVSQSNILTTFSLRRNDRLAKKVQDDSVTHKSNTSNCIVENAIRPIHCNEILTHRDSVPQQTKSLVSTEVDFGGPPLQNCCRKFEKRTRSSGKLDSNHLLSKRRLKHVKKLLATSRRRPKRQRKVLAVTDDNKRRKVKKEPLIFKCNLCDTEIRSCRNVSYLIAVHFSRKHQLHNALLQDTECIYNGKSVICLK